MKIKIWLTILSVICLLLSFACIHNYKQIKSLNNDVVLAEQHIVNNLNKLKKAVIKNDEVSTGLLMDYFERNNDEKGFNNTNDYYNRNKDIYKEWSERNFN